MDLAKAAAQIRPLRGNDAGPLLPRELELIAICNSLVHGQVVDAFPGAQPTSLTRQKIFDQLLKEPYVVCEKTDGERHLLLAYEGHVYLIDRKCRVWTCRVQLPLVAGHDLSPGWHHNTLLDGELVLDVEEGKTSLRYLVYDAMCMCGEDLTHRTLLYRLQKALSDVILPKEQLLALRESSDNVQLMLKDFFELWQLGDVTAIAAELPHGTDGLVFTPVMVPYAPGTCPALLKWKPAEMNTVDFKLQVIQGGDMKKNIHVKLLVGFKGKETWQVKHTGHWLAKMGDMFKKLREDPTAFDGKIAECKWHASAKTFTPSDQLKFTVNGSWEDGGWVLQRLREDKSIPNDLRTAKRVVESIQDDLNEEELLRIVLKAKEEGNLKAAADCGVGHLARVAQDVGSKERIWVPAVDASAASATPKGEAKTGKGKGKDKGRGKGKGKDDQVKGKGKGKGKAKGRGDAKAKGESQDFGEGTDHKSTSNNEREGASAEEQPKPPSTDSKARPSKAKGKGCQSGGNKGRSKGKRKKTRELDEEENLDLMQWSQQLETEQAEPAELAEQAGRSLPPEPTEAAHEPPLAFAAAPARPRTLADLLQKDPAEDVDDKMDQGVRAEKMKRSAPFSSPVRQQRPRTVADARGLGGGEVGPLLRRSGLKRKPRLPGLSDSGETGKPTLANDMPVTNVALGHVDAGYVPPVGRK